MSEKPVRVPGDVTCVIYARVSTDDQADKEFSSVDAQIAGCRRKAEANGWKILREFRDDGASGKNLNRPAMKELIAFLKHEEIGILLGVRMDRLSRDTVDTEFLMNLCRNRGTEILLLQQTLDERTASGRMGRRMGSVVSQFEREMTSDRVRFKRSELARNGQRPGGWTPPGYILLKEHTYALDEKYAPMVAQIFEQAAAGKRICDISAWLRAQCYVVRPRVIQRRTGSTSIGGRPFTWDQIKAIIRNPIYRAALKVDGTEHPLKIPAIVSDELWKKANAAIGRKPRPTCLPRQNKHEMLLHGLAICGCCKTSMAVHPGTSRQGKEYLYYRCQNLRKNGGAAGCTVRQIPAHKLDEAVIGQIGILAQDPVVLNAAMEEAVSGRKMQLLPLKAEIEALEQRIGELKRDYEKLRDRLLSLPKGSPFTDEIAAEGNKVVLQRRESEAQKQQLLEKKIMLEQQLGDARHIRSDLGRFSDIFEVLPPDKKRQALRLIIRRIVVNHLAERVTKSDEKNGQNQAPRHKKRFTINLDLYVKPKLSGSLRNESGICVFPPEMAARAGIEPATK
jgi:site-specific DNA recombinase